MPTELVGTEELREQRAILTARQLEILGLAADGRTNRQIGTALGISEKTVRNHMRDIRRRLSSRDRTHAVVIAIGRGWIPIPVG
jgi:DNA-binding CsgD family transcriptional regulator